MSISNVLEVSNSKKHPLDHLKQFIVHRQKTPSDYRTGQPANAHDSTVWTDYATATGAAAELGSEYGVGFVFTDADPYFFLDIDKCLVNGAWSPLAVQLCEQLRGCYVEVSQSGSGLHIIGSGALPAHACRNRELGLELYHTGRYMALGRNGQGDPAYSPAPELLAGFVAKYFPPSAEQPDGATWREGHELGWELPEDDELIQRALRMNGAAVAFGGKLSFKDLWEANGPALARQFPHPEKEYDASAADLALAGKLAWLTGNDCSRIERLMWRSGLVRDKWEKHKTYLTAFTIPRALVRDGSFYNPNYRENTQSSGRTPEEETRRRAQIEENIRIGTGVDIDECPVADYVPVDYMVRNFVKITDGKRVVDINHPRRIYSYEEWKSDLKASVTFATASNGEARGKPTENLDLWNSTKGLRKTVDTVTFRPGAKQITNDPEGRRAVNIWVPPVRTTTPGDAGLFVAHVKYLFGSEADHFLDWLAHIEQFPGDLPHCGWVHVSPGFGTGRNWLSSVLCRVWEGYTQPNFDLAETLRSGYNDSLSQRLLVIVDEINEGASRDKWANSERLKSIVTTDRRLINPKYGRHRTEFNCARWLIFSNHSTALPLTKGDRRFWVVRNDRSKKPSEYYSALYGALRDPHFIAGVAQFLRDRDLSGFNPGEHPQLTAAKQEMIGASKTDVDDAIEELVASHPRDVITNNELARVLGGQATHLDAKLTSHHTNALERAEVRLYRNNVWMGGKAVKVRILRDFHYWNGVEPDKIRAELERKGDTPSTDSFAKFAAKMWAEEDLRDELPPQEDE